MTIKRLTKMVVCPLFLLLAGCGLLQSKADEQREEIVETALDQVGEDYKYGGADPDDGFDCSGLVFYSYQHAGIKLPRSAAAQRKAGRAIKFADARPGDLLFYHFGDRKAGDLHVVMFIGDGEAVHAPVRDGEVEVIKITARHWRDRYVGAARYVRED
ncbi:MAG: C40 family peptidase [Nevskiaceae bacterium]